MPGQNTPLGFLPGEVDVGAHCMFVYPKRDTIYYDRVAGYLKAGLDVGEMCICASPAPVDSMLQHVQTLGVDTDHAVRTGQLGIYDSSEVYVHWGILDLRRTTAFWARKIAAADEHWNGIRIFGEVDNAPDSRTIRLKMLEYESKVNLASARINMALCGYQSSTTPRAMLVQMKSLHPFLASIRSIKTNHGYVAPSRFFNTFYRFQRVSRTYPAGAQYARECRRHFEELAARTPMSMGEIEDMKLALGEAFVNALEHGCAGVPGDRCHIHVGFLPQITGFTIEVRDHGRGCPSTMDDHCSERSEPTGRGILLMRNLVTDMDIERRKNDTVVTLHMEYSFPYGN